MSSGSRMVFTTTTGLERMQYSNIQSLQSCKMKPGKIFLCCLVLFLIVVSGTQGHDFSAVHAAAATNTTTCSVSKQNSTLDTLVDCLLDGMPQQPYPSGHIYDYVWPLPSEQEIVAWKQLVQHMVQMSIQNTDTTENTCLQLQGTDDYSVLQSVYNVEWYQENNTATTGEQYYCMLLQKELSTGWPSFFVKMGQAPTLDDSTVDVHLQIAHPVTDGHVAQQGMYLMRHSPLVKSLLITGATRDASLNKSDCQSSNYETDVAHNVNNLFHHTVVQLRETYISNNDYKRLLCIQFHGMAQTSCPGVTAYISNGYLNSPDMDLPFNRNMMLLKESISSVRLDWNITTPYQGEYCRLTGGTNVQGRVLNLNTSEPSPNPSTTTCTKSSSMATGTFLHIEQKMESVTSYQDWLEAVNMAFSVSPLNSSTTSSSSTAIRLSSNYSLFLEILLVVGTLIVATVL